MHRHNLLRLYENLEDLISVSRSLISRNTYYSTLYVSDKPWISDLVASHDLTTPIKSNETDYYKTG